MVKMNLLVDSPFDTNKSKRMHSIKDSLIYFYFSYRVNNEIPFFRHKQQLLF